MQKKKSNASTCCLLDWLQRVGVSTAKRCKTAMEKRHQAYFFYEYFRTCDGFSRRLSMAFDLGGGLSSPSAFLVEYKTDYFIFISCWFWRTHCRQTRLVDDPEPRAFPPVNDPQYIYSVSWFHFILHQLESFISCINTLCSPNAAE